MVKCDVNPLKNTQTKYLSANYNIRNITADLVATSARYWTYFQRRWQYKLLFTKTLGGKFKCDRRSNKWLGVEGSASIGLSLLGVNGRPFRIPSISTIKVRNASPETNCSLRTLKIFLTELITRSQTPPMCDAPGGLNFHSIFFWVRLFKTPISANPRLNMLICN